MIDFPLQARIAKAAQDLQEALQVQPLAMPPTGPAGAPPGPPQGMPAPGGPMPPQGPLSGPPPQDNGQLGLGPNQKPSPLQAVPSFRSAPFEAVLQKAAGRAQAPVGFSKGGRVRKFKVDMP